MRRSVCVSCREEEADGAEGSGGAEAQAGAVEDQEDRGPQEGIKTKKDKEKLLNKIAALKEEKEVVKEHEKT